MLIKLSGREMLDYLISQEELGRFQDFLRERGIKLEKFYSKGTPA